MWTLRYALSLIALAALGQLLVASLLLPLAGVDPSGDIEPTDLPGWWSGLVMILVNVGLLAEVAGRSRRAGATGAEGLPGWARPTPAVLAAGLAVGALAFLANVGFVLLVDLDLADSPFAEAFRTPADLVVLGGAVILVAPLFEEVVFRGALFHACLARGRVAAVLVSSALFAGVHLWTYWQIPLAVVPVALLGLALGALRLATGNVVACVVAHALFNTLGLFGGALLE